MMNSDGTFKEDIQCIVSENNGVGAIFVSNLQAACNPNTLKKHDIGAVITAIKGKNLSQKIPKHIEYLYIPVVDHESCNISMYFKDSFEFIDSQRKRTNVLVHCMAGVSRSVSLIIAYIMQKSGTPFLTAYNYVKSKRPIIHPNEAFVQQLLQHEKTLKNINVSDSEQKVQNKTSYGFGRSRHEQNLPQKSTIQAKYHYRQELSSKGQDFNNIQKSKTETGWFKKSKVESQFGMKQNVTRDQNNYDKRLRQNIKKLFSQSYSRVSQLNKSELMR